MLTLLFSNKLKDPNCILQISLENVRILVGKCYFYN
jgi:hypothetical protein